MAKFLDKKPIFGVSTQIRKSIFEQISVIQNYQSWETLYFCFVLFYVLFCFPSPYNYF
jgi:hypothetical protein